MRKVIITESQLKELLETFTTYLPNEGESNDIPSISYGNEVMTSEYPEDGDPEDASTPIDIHMGANQKYWRQGPSRRIAEANFDDNKTYFGKNEKEYFQQTAQNTNNKMLNNINKEKGARNNTNQVRINRMEKEKVENPNLFYQKGGEKTLKSLKNATNKVSKQNKMINKPIKPTINRQTGNGLGHHSTEINPFK